MKFKLLILFAFFAILTVSCDSGLKFENPLDPNNRTTDSEETGTLGGKCYPNKTCDNGLVCDKENNVCINPGNTDNNPATCGNRVLDKGEVCDGGAKECSEINAGYTSGYATCKTNCKGWDTTECQGTSVNPDPADSSDTTDTGDTSDTYFGDTDSGDIGDTADSGNSDIPLNCTGVSFDSDSFGMLSYAGGFQANIEGNLGNSLPDDIRFEFFLNDGNRNKEIKPGEYDLGTGRNTNYSTCNECLTIHQDITSYSPFEANTVFFQKTGTMKIESVDEENFIEGTVSAKLVEVIIDNTNHFTSTPVPDGNCLEIETGVFKKNAPTGCKEITLDSKLTFEPISDDIPAYYTSYTIDGQKKQRFGIELNHISDKDEDINGIYNDFSNTNYGDDGILDLIIYENWDGSDATGYYFQRADVDGMMVEISGYNSATHRITVKFTNVILEEITIDDLTSYPVSNGKCLKVKDTTVSY